MTMEAFERIIFQEQEYFLIGNLEDAVLATREQFENGLEPFAIIENGTIMRYHDMLALFDEIIMTGAFEVLMMTDEARSRLVDSFDIHFVPMSFEEFASQLLDQAFTIEVDLPILDDEVRGLIAGHAADLIINDDPDLLMGGDVNGEEG